MVMIHVDCNPQHTKLYIRSLAVFLCVALCFCFVLTPPAHAIAITMTTVGIGALVASFLAAVGIDLTFAGYDSSTGSQALEDLLVDYVVGHLGTTLDTWFGNGVIWSNGLLRLAPALAAKFEDFVDWFQTEYSITDNASGIDIVASAFSGQPIPVLSSVNEVFSSGFKIFEVSGVTPNYVNIGASLSDVYVFAIEDSTNIEFYAYNNGSAQVNVFNSQLANYSTSTRSIGVNSSSRVYMYTRTSISNYYVPLFSSLADGISAIAGIQSITADTGVISVPDTGGMTEDEELVIDVVYPGLSVMDWDLASQQIMSQALAGDLTATAAIEDAEVAEIVQTVDPLPNLLGINLPSFSFSLSGIWHYVRTWVSSLGSFMTSLFTVWNGLPYAMVVPVYATAVITIVVGLYRRFFM